MIFARVVVLVFFVYLVWRKLRGEYKVNDLLLYIWSSLLAFLIGGRLVFGLMHLGSWDTWLDWVLVWRVAGLTYWGSVIGIIAWTLCFSLIKKWKFLSLAEEMVGYYLTLLSGMLFIDFVWGGFQLDTVGWGVIGVIVLLFSLIFKEKYRSFVWFKSGKKGFVFWWGLFLYSLLSVFWLYFIKESWWWIILAGLTGLTSLGGLLILGGTFTLKTFINGGKKK